jgi:nucleolysin TIA-1/TIAR
MAQAHPSSSYPASSCTLIVENMSLKITESHLLQLLTVKSPHQGTLHRPIHVEFRGVYALVTYASAEGVECALKQFPSGHVPTAFENVTLFVRPLREDADLPHHSANSSRAPSTVPPMMALMAPTAAGMNPMVSPMVMPLAGNRSLISPVSMMQPPSSSSPIFFAPHPVPAPPNMSAYRRPLNADEFHLWVGDLERTVDDQQLKEAFISLHCTDARIMWDSSRGMSRGYGFVSFKTKEEAETAMSAMAGASIAGKSIRLNWAHPRQIAMMQGGGGGPGFRRSFSHQGGPRPHRRESASGERSPTHGDGKLDYEKTVTATSPSQTTVYVGGIPAGCTEDQIRTLFAQFGALVDAKFYLDRGFAFLRFDSHEQAAKAISELNGHFISAPGMSPQGSPKMAGPHSGRIRCAWGRSHPPPHRRFPPTFGGPSAAAAYPMFAPAIPFPFPMFAYQQPHQQQQPAPSGSDAGGSEASGPAMGYPSPGMTASFMSEGTGIDAATFQQQQAAAAAAAGLMYPAPYFIPQYYPTAEGYQMAYYHPTGAMMPVPMPMQPVSPSNAQQQASVAASSEAASPRTTDK